MHIGIIGAGMAGLICARTLLARGDAVTLYEKGRDPGGRMGTRRNELGGFDHGAQYFTVATELFKKEAAAWKSAGRVANWEPRLVSLKRGEAHAAGRNDMRERLVGVPGMGSLAEYLAHGLDLRTEQAVQRIESYGRQWLLSVQSDTTPIAATAGPFDAVVLALPADQAVPLLDAAPTFAAQADQARLAPCWALILGFQDTLGLDYDGAWVQESRLAWIAQDASKPQRRPGEHWVAHASTEWSAEHLEDDPARARDKLLKAFHEATDTHVQPVHASVHRWRYAQAVKPVPGNCLWDPELRIGVCGDWFTAGLEGGGRLENAYLSGLALGTAIA